TRELLEVDDQRVTGLDRLLAGVHDLPALARGPPAVADRHSVGVRLAPRGVRTGPAAGRRAAHGGGGECAADDGLPQQVDLVRADDSRSVRRLVGPGPRPVVADRQGAAAGT